MIIDFRVVPPFNEYTSEDEMKRVFTEGYLALYGNVYGDNLSVFKRTPEDIIQEMESAGVDYAVLQGEWGFGNYLKLNDVVYEIAQRYPQRFSLYFMGLDPGRNDIMSKMVEKEVRERNFSGVNIQSWATRLPITHRSWGSVYAKCQELGIPVAIHTSINFALDRPIGLGRPLHISEIAAEFPDLIIIANHAGWPWVTEMVGVAWKHPNVYIEIGAQSPKYIGRSGTGWEPLVTYGNSILQDKVLFATDSMLPQEQVIKELKELPLKDAVKEKWLGLNAEKLIQRIKNKD